MELLLIIEEFSIVYKTLPCDEIPRQWGTKYWIVVGVVGVLKVEPNDDAEYLKIAFDFTFLCWNFPSQLASCNTKQYKVSYKLIHTVYEPYSSSQLLKYTFWYN